MEGGPNEEVNWLRYRHSCYCSMHPERMFRPNSYPYTCGHTNAYSYSPYARSNCNPDPDANTKADANSDSSTRKAN